MLYLVFKWLHVLSAITALGSNITYGIWLSRAAQTPQALVYTLQTIRIIDNRLANRAYGVLLITGLIMVYIGRWAITTSWLITALVLYVVVGLLGFFAFAPNMRKQISIAETAGADLQEYWAASQRAAMLGVLTIIIVVIIVFLMVVKPNLWG